VRPLCELERASLAGPFFAAPIIARGWPEGELRGSILSRDPIRRVYCSAKAMVVETRQRRALIGGAPRWWE